MGRQRQRTIPLELRWRAPEALPPDDSGGVEIGFLRFLDDTTRVTVAPARRRVLAPHHLAATPVPALVRGWEVLVDGASQGMEPVGFLDACYAGWAVFVEIVPGVARVLCQSLAVRAEREGWDAERMGVGISHDELEEHERGPTRAGAAPVAGADP